MDDKLKLSESQVHDWLEQFYCELVDGQVIKESDGEPWALTKSEARQIVDELRKRILAASPQAGAQSGQVTPKMMSEVFAASVTNTDPEHEHLYDHRIAAELLNKMLASPPSGEPGRGFAGHKLVQLTCNHEQKKPCI